MTRAPSPLSVLSRCLDDAAVRCPSQFHVTQEPLVYAMFHQPAAVNTEGLTLDYCVILWLEAMTGWLVYFNGHFAYRVFPHETADVAGFLFDLRSNRLELGLKAIARYRAKA